MSASNWARCPRCAQQLAAKLDQMRAEVKAAYGNVTVEEFDTLRMALAVAESTTPLATLREDYEIYGAEDGTVIAEYGCTCQVCGLTADFTHRHELDV